MLKKSEDVSQDQVYNLYYCFTHMCIYISYIYLWSWGIAIKAAWFL